MKKFKGFWLAAVALLASGCSESAHAGKTVVATGKDVIRSVEVTNVKKIEASQAISVTYTIGSPCSVKVIAPESLADYVNVSCKNGKLQCSMKKGMSYRLDDRKINVQVVAPAVCELEAESSASIDVKGSLQVPKLEVSASSAASINIKNAVVSEADIEASSSGSVNIAGSLGRVDAESSSAASINISGNCTSLNAEASSAGSIKAVKAKIGSGNLEASSAGSISVSKATGTPYFTEKSSGGSITIK